MDKRQMPPINLITSIGIPRRRRRSKLSLPVTLRTLPLIIVIVLIMVISQQTQPLDYIEWTAIAIAVMMIMLMAMVEWGQYQAKKRQEELARIHEIDEMSGTKFEQEMVSYFIEMGFEVDEKPVSAKDGADFIITKDNQQAVVQTKRYKNKVGLSAVHEIITSRTHFKTEYALLITNNIFTKPAVQLAEARHVELWDRPILVEKLANRALAKLQQK